MKRFLVALVALAFLCADLAPAFAQTAPPPFSTGRLRLGTGTKTATATAGAATLSKSAGVITTEALVTAAAATYTLTLTNTVVAAADQCFISVNNGTNSAGSPQVERVTAAAGSMVAVVRNAHLSAAFNGTLKIAFMCLKN